MAKRFLDSDIFKKPFIKSLDAPYKLLWFYIISDCNHAGLWDVEIDVAQLKIGVPINEQKAINSFGEKIAVLNEGKKWFIPSFINFQYGTLNPENRSHASVIKLLSPYDICTTEGKIIKPLTSSIQAPTNGAMDMDTVKDMDKGGVGEKSKRGKKIFTPPTLEQVKEYFSLHGFSELIAERAWRGYEEAQWVDSKGQRVLNWKQKMNNVWFRDEHKIIVKENIPFTDTRNEFYGTK